MFFSQEFINCEHTFVVLEMILMFLKRTVNILTLVVDLIKFLVVSLHHYLYEIIVVDIVNFDKLVFDQTNFLLSIKGWSS